MSNNEIWCVIPNFENYEASNYGRIRRIKNKRIIKQSGSDIRNYQIVSIYTNGKRYTKKVARLIWAAFNQCDCDQTIDHIDRNVKNNNITNLRCVSMGENFKNRTIYKGKNKYNLKEEDKIEIVKKYRAGEWTSWTIAKIYGVPTNYIITTLKRGSWDKLWEKQRNQDIDNITQ